VETVLVEILLSGWEDMSSSTPPARRRNLKSEFGGASRDRTDDLIVANDGVAHSYLTDSTRPSRSSLPVFILFIGSITEAQTAGLPCLPQAEQFKPQTNHKIQEVLPLSVY